MIRRENGMKLTKRMKEALGLSMLISAVSMVVTFVVDRKSVV